MESIDRGAVRFNIGYKLAIRKYRSDTRWEYIP